VGFRQSHHRSRDEMVQSSLTRDTVNARVQRAFRRAVSVQLIPGSAIVNLDTVKALADVGTEVRPTEPERPVSVEATLLFLSLTAEAQHHEGRRSRGRRRPSCSDGLLVHPGRRSRPATTGAVTARRPPERATGRSHTCSRPNSRRGSVAPPRGSGGPRSVS